MDVIPFKTYQEAVAHFDFQIPVSFFENLKTVEKYCLDRDFSTLEVLFELFGMLRIEGDEARYQQTPVELFPFSSTGSDGIHMGFVVHFDGRNDYPSAMLEPMDTEGIQFIGANTRDSLQNLLTTEEEIIEQHADLIEALNLQPGSPKEEVNIWVPDHAEFMHLQTEDGVGVLAETKFFHNPDELNELSYYNSSFDEYMELANKMNQQGYYASQLYFLKQVYWNEWTNYAVAKELLQQMLTPYEKLNRRHLYEKTTKIIETFDKRFR
jgi:hypothetical protein